MLNNIGLPGLLLIAVVVLVLFGRGKISSLMGEVGKGITSFKKGIKEGTDEIESAADEPRSEPRAVPGETARDVTPHTTPAAGSNTTDRS
ncbi:twin-arginine translocase TatA/TatE family subunit [Paracoccus indicus]|uniref:twin-arginine translocase TatA/TatE family subunit n=1 Tax=Paracoccus indicus TaxID=2079229 RepID=UPI001FE315BE|nr:twin-arginine translocase TatA/TatE family subunit [Paracoccus indicus]